MYCYRKRLLYESFTIKPFDSVYNLLNEHYFVFTLTNDDSIFALGN